MKRKVHFTAILFIMMLMATTANAATYLFKTYLPSEAMPIKLEISGETYWFVSGNEQYLIDWSKGNNYRCEDAYGQKISIETAHLDDGSLYAYVGGITVSWANHGKRRIRGFENGRITESNSSNESETSYENNDYNQEERSNYYEEKYGDPEKIAKKVTDAGKAVAGGIGDAITFGDKQFVIHAGFGRAWGTYGRLEGRFGSSVAFAVYGGAGQDLVWNLDNKDKLSWHGGMGVVFALNGDDGLSSASDISFGLTYGETSAYVNKALLIELGCELFFGKSHRFGIYGSAGFGLGNFNEDIKDWFFENRKYVWDVTAGLVLRIP